MKLSIRRVLVAALSVLAAQAALAGTIVGSKHDFKANAWSNGEICLPCHAPHNNLNATGSLLWNHASTTATYTLYSSPTMDSSMGQPSGVSKLCLSCHDGTVAIDSFGGATGATTITGVANFGTNLGNDHPISISYATAFATDGALKADTTAATIGSGGQTKAGTIATVLLNGGSVECSSCHDVHNTFTAGATGLLKINNAGSALCLTCHTK